MTDQQVRAPARDRRPWQIWVASIVLVFGGALAVVQLIALVASLATLNGEGLGPSRSSLVVYGLAVALTIGQAAVGVFLFLGRSWARITVLALAVAGILMNGLLALMAVQGLGLSCYGATANIVIFAMLMNLNVASWMR